jgi:hypothetical protein
MIDDRREFKRSGSENNSCVVVSDADGQGVFGSLESDVVGLDRKGRVAGV